MQEVPPTGCSRATDSGGYVEPVWWHPMVPIAMGKQDFATLATWVSNPVNLPFATAWGLSVVHAQQNSVDVGYTPTGPAGTPSYWSTIPGSNGKVLLVNSISGSFCVNSTTGQVQQGPSCSAGFNRYGTDTPGLRTRFVDWGLVSDDLSRPTPQTFFQKPTCTTCNAGGPNGLQDGIRVIPLPPQLDVLSRACMQNVNPGTNVFDRTRTTGPNLLTCNPPITQVNSSTVTFSGTKANPEALVIDNGGCPNSTCGPQGPDVQITGSLPGTDTLRCDTTNWDNYNWGFVLATGNITIMNKLVLTGFIYSGGTVTSNDTTLIRGSVTNSPGQNNHFNPAASIGFCPGDNTLVLSNVLFTFTAASWQDVPLNKP
jgi:hypothetical protein